MEINIFTNKTHKQYLNSLHWYKCYLKCIFQQIMKILPMIMVKIFCKYFPINLHNRFFYDLKPSSLGIEKLMNFNEM